MRTNWWTRGRASRLAGTLAVMGIVTLAQGCSSRAQTRSPFDGPAAVGSSSTEDPIRIEVQNLNFNDITIWALRNGQRVRLGRVTGKTDHTFRIGWNVAIPISFNIDVTGGRSCNTQQIGVEPNAVVLLSIPNSVGNQPCRIGRR